MTSTFAWYSATEAGIAAEGDSNTFTAASTTVSLGTLTLTLHIDNPSGHPGPTDSSGKIKILIDGSPVEQSDSFYDKTGSFTWYVTAALGSGSGAGGDGALVAALKEHADTYTVTFSGTNLKFGTNTETAIAESATSGGTVTASFVIDGNGAISVTEAAKATHYFGVTEAQETKGATITISGAISGGDIE